LDERSYTIPKEDHDVFYRYLQLEPLQPSRCLSLTMMLHVHGSCPLASTLRTDDGSSPLATLTTSSDPTNTSAHAWLHTQTPSAHWVPAETDESPTLRLAFPHPVQLKALLFKPGLQVDQQALAVVVSARIRDPATGRFAWQRIRLERPVSRATSPEDPKETEETDPDAPQDLMVYFGDADVDEVIHLRCMATEAITDLKITAIDWQGQPAMAVDALVRTNMSPEEPEPEVVAKATTPPPASEDMLTDDLARAQELLALLEQHTLRASMLHESLLACLPVANETVDGPVALLVREALRLQEGAEPQAEQLVEMLKSSKGKQLE
jgi:hypothetical protein